VLDGRTTAMCKCFPMSVSNEDVGFCLGERSHVLSVMFLSNLVEELRRL